MSSDAPQYLADWDWADWAPWPVSETQGVRKPIAMLEYTNSQLLRMSWGHPFSETPVHRICFQWFHIEQVHKKRVMSWRAREPVHDLIPNQKHNMGQHNSTCGMVLTNGNNIQESAIIGDIYPLAVKIAIENGHRNSGFTHWKLWFSIVILVYQRVNGYFTIVTGALISQQAWGWNTMLRTEAKLVPSLACIGHINHLISIPCSKQITVFNIAMTTVMICDVQKLC